MSQGDWHILVIVGGVLLLLGILGIIWGMREEQKLFDALSKKPDLREFSLKHLESPQPGALKIGGWIAVGIGLVLIIIGIVLWRTGWPPG
jgi:uncharacterized membrane protein